MQKIESMTAPAPGEWPANCAIGLEDMIALFKQSLPGWWFSLGECDVSCDASCAPTRHSPDIHRIGHAGDRWDAGFHADLPQPSSLAAALADVMAQAVEAREGAPPQPARSDVGEG